MICNRLFINQLSWTAFKHSEGTEIPATDVMFSEDIGCFCLVFLLFAKVISFRGLAQIVSSSSARAEETLLTPTWSEVITNGLPSPVFTLSRTISSSSHRSSPALSFTQRVKGCSILFTKTLTLTFSGIFIPWQRKQARTQGSAPEGLFQVLSVHARLFPQANMRDILF